MKYAVLISGAVGFAIVAIAGVHAGRQSDLVLRDAALGCLAMAFVGRWFWGVVDRAFAETFKIRQAAAEAAEAAAAAAEKPATPSAPAKTPPPKSATVPPTPVGAGR